MITTARALVSGLLALGGSLGLQAANSLDAQQAFQRCYAFSPRGRVTVENLYGDVRIIGWDRHEVRIEAIKSGADSGRLDDARIVVDATAERVSVRTQYAGSESP